MNAFICGEEFSKKSTIKSKQLAIVVVYKVATITSHPNQQTVVFVILYLFLYLFLL